MKRVIKSVSFAIVILSLLCVFSYGVYLASTKGKSLGKLAEPLKAFATFPATVTEVLTSKEIQNISPTFVRKTGIHKNQYNKLDYDLWGINSGFSPEKNEWVIKLFNFRNDEVVHEWILNKKSFVQSKREFPNSIVRSPILLSDKSILFLNEMTDNFYRLDSSSNIVWHNTQRTFHHTMNFDADSNLWVCTLSDRLIKYGNKKASADYVDNFITKMDRDNGKILYEKSITDILIKYGYRSLVFNYNGNRDPIHLNDIQPAVTDTKYWKTGDLFLSLRHCSLILVYRPETDEIIHYLSGPFLRQHDVDIISDHEIAIFNNNLPGLKARLNNKKTNPQQEIKTDSIGYNEILVYNFETREYTTRLKSHFDSEKIFSASQGEYEFLSNGDVYVENQNEGIVYIMNENEILLRKVFQTPLKNYVEQPHWIRIYENLNFLK